MDGVAQITEIVFGVGCPRGEEVDVKELRTVAVARHLESIVGIVGEASVGVTDTDAVSQLFRKDPVGAGWAIDVHIVGAANQTALLRWGLVSLRDCPGDYSTFSISVRQIPVSA